MIGPLNGFPKRLSYGGLPIRQEILNVSQIRIAFHGICPPIFIQTWLQQYGRGAFFNSAHCSFSNTISLRSVWCRRTMIPRKDLHKLCPIPRNCQCRWLYTSYLAPRTFASSFVSPEKFLFCAGCAWIHWVAKSCTTIAYRWLFRDSQLSLRTLWSAVIKSPKFSARSTAPPMRLLHGGPCNFGPLTDLAISVIREVSINTVFTHIHTSRRHRPKRWFMRRTGVWVSAFRNSVIHEIFSEFLQPFGYVGMTRVSPLYLVVLVFIWFGFLVGLVNKSPPFCPFNMWSWHKCWMGIYPSQIFPCSGLTVAWHTCGCEVDELEEDVGWLHSCLEVEGWELEEELADKPGTTIGTKFSVLHCVRKPFSMRCGFWPLIHS